MLFRDRNEAGQKLADKLHHFRGLEPLILAVPRGGVIVAEPVWSYLGGELDLIITRKIGAPDQPELAIGAVSGDGLIMLNDQLVSRLNVDYEYINKRAGKEQKEIRRRMTDYRGNQLMPEVDGRQVILIDDGVATGYTLLAALHSLQKKQPAKLMLAVPIGPADTFSVLDHEVDELIFIDAPAHFAAVGQFYRDFSQVDDQEVKIILEKAGRKGG